MYIHRDNVRGSGRALSGEALDAQYDMMLVFVGF
jgi:hypothetical protein